jgi:hypothetical protein
MKTKIDDYELCFPINIWDKMIYENIQEFRLDIYYNEKGYPANIHDLYGAKEVDDFKLSLINEICKNNNTDNIWQISSVAFAIESKCSNIGNFEFKYKGIISNILKKTIIIKLLSNK